MKGQKNNNPMQQAIVFRLTVHNLGFFKMYFRDYVPGRGGVLTEASWPFLLPSIPAVHASLTL